MLLPMAQEVRRRATTKVYAFGGYNANVVVKDGELTSSSNLGSDNFPCLGTRSSRATHSAITTPNDLYTMKDKLATVDGTDFKYDGTTKGTVTSGEKSMVEFLGVILIFPDKKYYNIGTNTFGTIGTGTYPTAGACPDIDYACVHNNRVFGVKGNYLYACKFGVYTDWTTLGELATDAYATNVSETGDFTGIVAYQNHVTIFKKDLMYELYGTMPSNFTMSVVAKKGALNNKSIVEINSFLYFLSSDGINIYSGGLPRVISANLNQTYTSGVAGTDGYKYYISLYDGSVYKLFVYDPRYDIWLQEDALRVMSFARLNGVLYAMSNETSSKIYIFKSGSEVITWSAETKAFDQNVMGKKFHGKIRVKAELSSGATLNISVKSDNNAYEAIKTYTTTQLQYVVHQFIPKRCDTFKIKLDGVGNVKIYALEFEVDVSTDA